MAKIFPEGIFYNKPREGSPEFVRGSLSIQVEKLIPFLEKHKNAQGYVNIDMLLSKEKSLYLALNEWKKPESLTDDQKKSIQTARDNEILAQKRREIDSNDVFNNF